MRIFLDMDNVLADFDAGACAAHGTTLEEVSKHRVPGEWGLEAPIGLAIGRELDADGFWDPIHAAGPDFWEHLPVYSWVDDLVKLVEQYATEWHILTAPSRHESCYLGKIRWIKRQFGKHFDRFIPTRYKYLVAFKDAVLIDDRVRNCDEFRKAGGMTVLFPYYGNPLHELRDIPLTHVSNCVHMIQRSR